MNAARGQTIRIIGDMLTSNKQLFEHHFAKAKEDGFVSDDADVSFEAMREFIERGEYTIEIPTATSLASELSIFDDILKLIGSRHWSLMIAAADAPDFVTCDHPVSVVFKDRKIRGPIGYGLRATEVSFPLGPRHSLLGVFEDPFERHLEAATEQVADFNTRIVMHADRQIYSRTDEVIVLQGEDLQRFDVRSNTPLQQPNGADD